MMGRGRIGKGIREIREFESSRSVEEWRWWIGDFV